MVHSSGGQPGWIQLNSFRGQNLSIAVAATSMANPAESANAGMLAVGAANWATPNTIESFSSRGSTPDGRTKPEIVGADGGDSVTYGPRGFLGTSQASPHIAGLAALVLDRFPNLTPQQVASYLTSSAEPRPPSVPNNTWGFGFAQLPPLPPGPPTNAAAVAGNGRATVSWNAPASDGGSPITKYTAVSDPGGHTAEVGGSTLSATVTGLSNGTSYTFAVTASNAEGAGEPSEPSNAVTPIAPSPTPTPVPSLSGWGMAATAVLLGIALLLRGGRPSPQGRPSRG